jgi:uncharacterized protein (DUF1684 family)
LIVEGKTALNNQNFMAYRAEVEAWRQQREAALRSPDGWLSLTGLFMLSEGDYRVGSHPESQILLPAGTPDHLGTLEFREGKAHLTVATATPVLMDGKPVQEADLVDNGDRKQPSLVSVGTVTFFVHKFGEEHAIRVKDSANPAIDAFAGCKWFPVKPEYRVQGRLARHDAPRAIAIRTIVDTEMNYESVGNVEFDLQGQALSLLARDYGVPNQLSIVFRDATAGLQTYAAARFLTVEVDGDENVVVDFNKAYNPPCSFSPYATCPLPPRENILPVAIEAGERYTPEDAALHGTQHERTSA